MSKLTETQITILTAATARPNGDIEPLPASINAGIKPRVIAGLLKRGLVVELNGKYCISHDGYAAIGVTPATPAVQLRADTKQAKMMKLLKRPEGATLNDMCAETGWLKHTVRGVLVNTFKKRLKLTISSHKEDNNERRYRLVEPS